MTTTDAHRTDVLVLGAGIVGLAVADALLDLRPGVGITVLEKEGGIAQHQTGHNSGVLHTGLYYRPGSLKALLCREGRAQLIDRCADEGVRTELCGKVVVATTPDEVPALEALQGRAEANGVEVVPLDVAGLAEREPAVRGVRALLLPGAGLADFRGLAQALAARVRREGGAVVSAAEAVDVVEVPGGVVVPTPEGTFRARALVNAAGLHADRVASLVLGRLPDVRILPFRGEYRDLRPDRRHLVRHLVYPVPDPRLPFLGVHLTRGLDGGVHAGPGAVLALAREGYRRRDVDLGDVAAIVSWPGLWRLAVAHRRTAVAEVARSASRRAFAAAARRLVPDLRAEDLGAWSSGVRAQAVRRDGTLVDDFVIERTDRTVHVVNAPSPAATASLAIGRHVAQHVVAALR